MQKRGEMFANVWRKALPKFAINPIIVFAQWVVSHLFSIEIPQIVCKQVDLS